MGSSSKPKFPKPPRPATGGRKLSKLGALAGKKTILMGSALPSAGKPPAGRPPASEPDNVDAVKPDAGQAVPPPESAVQETPAAAAAEPPTPPSSQGAWDLDEPTNVSDVHEAPIAPAASLVDDGKVTLVESEPSHAREAARAIDRAATGGAATDGAATDGAAPDGAAAAVAAAVAAEVLSAASGVSQERVAEFIKPPSGTLYVEDDDDDDGDIATRVQAPPVVTAALREHVAALRRKEAEAAAEDSSPPPPSVRDPASAAVEDLASDVASVVDPADAAAVSSSAEDDGDDEDPATRVMPPPSLAGLRSTQRIDAEAVQRAASDLADKRDAVAAFTADPSEGGVSGEEPPTVLRCKQCGAHFSAGARFCPFDGGGLEEAVDWDPQRDPLIGRTIADRYRVESVLAEGGMGTIYRVRHVTLGNVFAMKVLRRDLAQESEIAERLIAEARATAMIGHPNIAAVTDFGEVDAAQLQDGAGVNLPYFIMEYIEGHTLGAILRRDGALPLDRVVPILTQIASALAAAHRAGIVHRDLKPDNIRLMRDDMGKEIAKVLDFGVAKVMGVSKKTRAGMVFGTPHYMSPEQGQGMAIDRRSDVYALGIIMYECLSGAPPFVADTFMGVVTKHLFAQPPPMPEVTGLQGSPIERVVLRCLEKDRENRYPSMPDLVADLEHAVSQAQPTAALPQATQQAAQLAQPALPRPRPRRRRRWPWVLLAVALVALGGALAAVVLGAFERKPAANSASSASTSRAPARATPTSTPRPSSNAPTAPRSSAAPAPSSAATGGR